MEKKLQQLKDFMHEVNTRLSPMQPKRQNNMPLYQTYPYKTNSTTRREFEKTIVEKATTKAHLPREIVGVNLQQKEVTKC